MSFGAIDKEGVPEQLSVSEADISWNTHRALRAHFDYPEDDEFIGDWLQWFYNSLNVAQRTALRNTPIDKIVVAGYPSPPFTANKENN